MKMAAAKLSPFQCAPVPEIHFAPGIASRVGEVVSRYGNSPLLVTADRSFDLLDQQFRLMDAMRKGGTDPLAHFRISGEPSPADIDEIVEACRHLEFDVVVGIGGGSVLDSAKCISGLLPTGDSIMAYLEGVGEGKQHDGVVTPFIALPTTAGTGSETTMNGVVADRTTGFKKSFRHPALVPDAALVDPDLLATCPPELIAANGCDALSQLLESYLSTRASLFTDTLVVAAIEQLGRGLIPLWRSEGSDGSARAAVAYGSMVSGITLANAGLGTVHGLAGPIGGLYPIPHGVVCGTLIGEANRVNIEALMQRDPESVAVEKYRTIGERLGFCSGGSTERCLGQLSDGLSGWVETLQIPRLGEFGVTHGDIPRIMGISDQKDNPVELTGEEFAGIVAARV